MDEDGKLPITELLLEWSEVNHAALEQMTPLVRSRLDPDAFDEWAWHRQLVIDESRTYRRIR